MEENIVAAFQRFLLLKLGMRGERFLSPLYTSLQVALFNEILSKSLALSVFLIESSESGPQRKYKIEDALFSTFSYFQDWLKKFVRGRGAGEGALWLEGD
jgi:hypothetical protein